MKDEKKKRASNVVHGDWILTVMYLSYSKKVTIRHGLTKKMHFGFFAFEHENQALTKKTLEGHLFSNS